MEALKSERVKNASRVSANLKFHRFSNCLPTLYDEIELDISVLIS